jgi:hypothetical protein
MGKDKEKKKKKKDKKKNDFHYDPNSFFIDDVLKEIEERHKDKKKINHLPQNKGLCISRGSVWLLC